MIQQRRILIQKFVELLTKYIRTQVTECNKWKHLNLRKKERKKERERERERERWEERERQLLQNTFQNQAYQYIKERPLS
jgi:hypothetical protein